MHPTARGRRARIAVAVAFAAQGVCFASLVTRIPSLKDRFGLSDGALALLLLLVPVVAGGGSVAAGTLAARFGSRRVLRVLGPLVPLALVLVGLSPSVGLLVVALVLVGLGLGSVDATMNMQGVDVQVDYGRPVMASFYAVFSLATIVGAVLAAAAAATTLALAAFFAVLAVVVVPVQLAVGRWLARHDEAAEGPSAAEDGSGGPARVPWRPILLIGVVLTCAYVLDSGAANWSAVYLTDGLGSSESVAALAYGIYSVTLLAGRSVADRLVLRLGPTALVRAGGLVAAAATAAIALAPSAVVGLLGFALLGVGLAAIAPLAFTAASSHDPAATGTAVARVNVFNYVGFVVGAPLIGLVAEASSLRWGFATAVPVALVIVALAGALRPAGRT
jgi:MFS family permease